jgi:hypothetical protein
VYTPPQQRRSSRRQSRRLHDLTAEEIDAAATEALRAAAARADAVIGIANASSSSSVQQIPYNNDYFDEQPPGTMSCGRHALNNLFHNYYVGLSDPSRPIDDATIQTIGPPIPLQDLCMYLNGKFPFLGGCPPNENYDINILLSVLDVLGHPWNENVWTIAADGTTAFQPRLPPDQLLGYILNYGGGHWVALRKVPEEHVQDGNAYEYIDSMKPATAKKRYTTAQDCLDYVQTQDMRRISNIIEVGTYGTRVNPVERLNAVNQDAFQKAQEAQLFGDAKAALYNMFYRKYGAKLTNATGLPLHTFILNKFLSQPYSLQICKDLHAELDLPDADVDRMADFMLKNRDRITTLENTEAFVVFLREKGKGTADEPCVPGAKTILVNVVGNTFILDVSENAVARRKAYSEDSGKGSLDAEELRLLTFLGTNPDDVKSLLSDFFAALPTCNTDSTVTINSSCDVPIHFLWKLRELRREAAKQSMRGKTLVSGFQLAALRRMASEAGRMLTFAKMRALFKCSTDAEEAAKEAAKEAAAKEAAAAETIETTDEEKAALDNLFTV